MNATPIELLKVRLSPKTYEDQELRTRRKTRRPCRQKTRWRVKAELRNKLGLKDGWEEDVDRMLLELINETIR